MEALTRRFEESLGVRFQEALDLTAFVAYWGLAQSAEQALDNPASTLINRDTWLRQTNFAPDIWERYLNRVSLRLEEMTGAVAGAGSPWFDPLRLRDRPLIELPNGLLSISMPDLVAEKCSFHVLVANRRAWRGAPENGMAGCVRCALRTIRSLDPLTGCREHRRGVATEHALGGRGS